MFHDPAEAERWQDALDFAGLPAECAVYDEPFKDDRGFWQPPRYHWYDYTCPTCGKLLHVYIIDDVWWRNNVRIDWSEGGNHMAYEENPPDCIYVAANNHEDQIDTRIVAEHHEAPEECLMENDPMCVYEEAHGIATREEREYRDAYRDPRVTTIARPGSQS